MQKVLCYYIDNKIKNTSINKTQSLKSNLHLEVFKPSFLNLKEHKGDFIIQLLWYVLSLSKNVIIYIKDKKGNIIHMSQLTPKIFKFPFMQNNDLQVGTCWTIEEYRGQGIYPFVINYIVDNYLKSNKIFMITRKDNYSSQKGIEKAGFKLYGEGLKKMFGIYKINKLHRITQY